MATTSWPAPSSRAMTASQDEDSAKAPWTRTMVGCMDSAPWVATTEATATLPPGTLGARPSDPLVRSLGRGRRDVRLGERRAELLARPDAELREHLVQVVLDRPRADEQLGADLLVRLPMLREPGHLRLLRGEHVARLDGEPAHRLARRRELATRALGERLCSHAPEELVGGAQLFARVHAAALAPEPFAVEQARASELGPDPGALEPLDRLLVEAFSLAVLP